MSNDPRRPQDWAGASGSSASSGRPASYGPLNDAAMYQRYLALQNNGSQHQNIQHQQDRQQLMQAAPTARSFPPVIHPVPQHQWPRQPPPAALHMSQQQRPRTPSHAQHSLPHHQTQPPLQRARPGSGNPTEPNLPRSIVQNPPAQRQMKWQDDRETDRGPSNRIGGSMHGISTSQGEHADDPMEQHTSGRHSGEFDEYTHLHSLMSEQQALLDAHIAEVAYQQALVERQLAMEDELTKEMYDRLVRTQHTEVATILGRHQEGKQGEEGQSDVLQERGLETVQRSSAHHSVKDAGQAYAAQCNRAGITESSKDYSAGQNAGPIEPKDDGTLGTSAHIPMLHKQFGGEKNRSEFGLCSHTASDTSSKGVKRKNYQTILGGAKGKKKPAIPFPKHYTTFVSDIHSDPQADTVIHRFNEIINPAGEKDLVLAVSEDKEHIRMSRAINQKYYKEQIDTMDMRLKMYSNLEKEFDKIISEQSAHSASKNTRSSSAHVREVTMDLIHIGMNNYQMLESNMDKILGL